MGRSLANGRYTLGKLLGVGGMAEVYEATDTVLGAQRAVKLLRLGDSDWERLRSRLMREASVMARLNHPHVLRVVDVGREGGQDYVVMELAAAGSLSDRMDSLGTLPMEDVIRWVVQILSALQAAHDLGVVHRDVKPHNVLLDARGNALLADFGIALISDADSRHTRTDAGLGSLVFMAPEQRLDARGVGPAADIYAVGCTLFMMLTGASPMDLFVADPSSARWQLLPEALRPIVRRAVALRPEDRYPSARALAEELAALHPEGPALLRTFEALRPPEGAGPRTTFPLGASTLADGAQVEPTLPESRSVLDAAAASARPAPPPVAPPPDAAPSRAWAGLVALGLLLLAALTTLPEPPPDAPQVAPSPAPTSPIVATAPDQRAAPTPTPAPAPPSRAARERPPSAQPTSAPAAAAEPAVARLEASSPAGASVGVLGSWSGTLAGFMIDLQLSGAPEHLTGATQTWSASGKKSVQTRVEGRYDGASHMLTMKDVSDRAYDDLCVWSLTLSADQRSLTGTCTTFLADGVTPRSTSQAAFRRAR